MYLYKLYEPGGFILLSNRPKHDNYSDFYQIEYEQKDAKIDFYDEIEQKSDYANTHIQGDAHQHRSNKQEHPRQSYDYYPVYKHYPKHEENHTSSHPRHDHYKIDIDKNHYNHGIHKHHKHPEHIHYGAKPPIISYDSSQEHMCKHKDWEVEFVKEEHLVKDHCHNDKCYHEDYCNKDCKEKLYDKSHHQDCELARAFVCNQRFEDLFSPEESLCKGTIFKDLYRPHKKIMFSKKCNIDIKK